MGKFRIGDRVKYKTVEGGYNSCKIISESHMYYFLVVDKCPYDITIPFNAKIPKRFVEREDEQNADKEM